MPEFIVRMEASSVIRLGKKAYYEEAEQRSLHLGFHYADFAFFDRLVQVSEDIGVPDGLIILVKLRADNIDIALNEVVSFTDHALSMMSCVAMCAADVPYPVWAYEATPGVDNREYRHFFYDGIGLRASRPLNDQHLIALLERNYDAFMADATFKLDFKARLQRSMMAFRRGLSDNDDVLNEFLTAWSTMEGLDCVYREVLPGPSVRDFKDGMRDVLQQIGSPEVFAPLERLRNDIAHGSLSLDQAMKMARSQLDLIRHSLVLMILRILKVDEGASNEIIQQTVYKGKSRPHFKIIATIRFEPVDIRDPTNQPVIQVWREGINFSKNGDKLEYKPEIKIKPMNVSQMTPVRMEFWGDPGAPIRKSYFSSVVTKQGEGSSNF
jgi:hypothetical protein